MQLLHKTYGPNQPDGSTIINGQKVKTLKVQPPHIMSPTDFKFHIQIQLNVLYTKKFLNNKGHHDGFFDNLHNLKNRNVNGLFWISTASTPNLVYSLGEHGRHQSQNFARVGLSRK